MDNHEAIPLAPKLLTIQKKVLGLDHPDVALTLGNLVFLCSATGRYAEAQPLCKRFLAIRTI